MSAARRVKSFIKSRFPQVVEAYHKAQQPSLKTVFSEIYHQNAWQNPETVSGRGSTLARSATIMSHLPSLLKDLQAKTLLDAACGDFNWMRCIELGAVKYIGADVVPDLIDRNRRLYGDQARTFVVLDLTKDKLPSADVILCRDCLIHLSFRSIHAVVANFKRSAAKHLICTTHTTVKENTDCPDGAWRSLNLELSPLNFPPPQQLIVEDEELGKCLGVWRLEEL